LAYALSIFFHLPTHTAYHFSTDALAVLFVQSITVISVVSPITLHTSIIGNYLFLTDSQVELAHHPDKAFVQQLTFNLTHGYAIGYIQGTKILSQCSTP